MVTNVTNLSRSGLYDWMAQRVSAVVLAAYFLFLLGYMVASPDLGYAQWHALFSQNWMRIFSLMALVAALMYEKMGRTATSRIAGGVVSEIIMVLGYFGYASLLLGKGLAAAASIPGNIFQGAVGLVVGVLLVTVLERAKVTEKLA